MNEHVERDQLIPAPPEEVWAVITSDGWLAEEVSLGLYPGGDASFGSNGRTREGWVEEAIAPVDGAAARLVYWWADEDAPASRVELTLEPDGETHTRLRVVETRPLEVLDVIGMPLPGASDAGRGPVLLAVA
jgi:uncharacterized protein YndB with AHSA1/START domain